jgi:hypothetical protein
MDSDPQVRGDYNDDKAWRSFTLDQAFVHAVLFDYTLQRVTDLGG